MEPEKEEVNVDPEFTVVQVKVGLGYESAHNKINNAMAFMEKDGWKPVGAINSIKNIEYLYIIFETKEKSED